jgi:hypothetical protein
MSAKLLSLIIIVTMFLGCNTKHEKADPKLLTDRDIMHRNMNQLTEVIINDMFSPPVSSRIYAYTSLAAYEAIKFDKPGYSSITEKLNSFPSMPLPEKSKPYNYLLAATKAFFTVAEKITFSADTLNNYKNRVFADFKTLLDEETYNRSIEFGSVVGKKILERTTKDNYKETRGMPKFLGSNETGKWRPTPPDYSDAAEPNWSMILPLAIDSSAGFKCPLANPYSTDTTSAFYKNLYEVYTIGANLTDEQKLIAKYWDDNPFVTEHSGHLMYGNKKITPVGHWIGITSIACKMKNLDAVETARLYSLTTTAIFDAIITCWEEKFRSQQVRPITVINELIDRGWQPFLQTPPFPEHTSGHSGISASAATVLTVMLGDNFAFEDTSDLAYIGMKRSFKSFNQAAQEASLSRVYGGIHYRNGVDAGAFQGRQIAEYVLNKLSPKDASLAGH